MRFDDVIAPMTREEFLLTYASRQCAVIKGAPGRFEKLVTWAELNAALEHVRVNDDRVYLIRNAQKIPRESYVQSTADGRAQYLIGPAVSRQIAKGATLVVNGIDELLDNVRSLSESCEDVFGTYVSANLYAGWRTDKGFDVHWDSHDTLIVQVRGRKDWKVWNPTRLHPLSGDGRTLAPLPSEDPVWTGPLQGGECLYMPRGWWHVAHPRSEPSVHLTFGINHKTGLDLLNWVVKEARDAVSVRMDVPHWRSAEEQAEWVRAVRAACSEVLTDDAVRRYMTSVRERAHTRPFVRLPESTIEGTIGSLGEGDLLRLTHGARLELSTVEGSEFIEFKALAKIWRCHRDLTPALVLMHHVTPRSVSELSHQVDQRLKPLLRTFLTALIAADVIWVDQGAQNTASGLTLARDSVIG